jgi:glutaminyl-peptide cyclotransferase
MTPTDTGAVERLRAEVVATYPHDSTAFTEGLVLDNGHLFESTGLYGDSSLREVEPTSGQVLRTVSLPSQFFGEGLALADNRLVQLSWRETTAFIYDPTTFTPLGKYTYAGEGWGLCFDGRWFYMSDGSSRLTLRDPRTFEPAGVIPVVLSGQPVELVNELECVGDWVYANVWHTDQIIRIDKATGGVSAVIQASGLLTPDQQRSVGPEGVLNGIAYDPARATFLITGKHWPSMFEVRFVPASP